MSGTISISGSSVDITPTRRVPLAGFASRKSPYEGVADPLEANILCIRSPEETVVLISADLLYVTEEIRQELIAHLGRKGWPLQDTGVFLAATHTHYAPGVDRTKPLLGPVEDGYLRHVVETIAAGVEETLRARAVPGRPVFRSSRLTEHSVNRRRRGWTLEGIRPARGMRMLPNPAGCNDERTRSIVFLDDADNVVAMIWNYSCHPTSFPSPLQVSADFPGKARAVIRAWLGSKAPVLFLQGFSGNVRALTKEIRFTARNLAERMINGPGLFGRFTEGAYGEWTERLSDHLLDSIRHGPAESPRPQLASRRVAIPLAELVRGSRSQGNLTIHQVVLGKGLRVVGVSAEPVVEYVELFESLFPGEWIVPVGCTGSVFGYLPTDRIVAEGGYEGGGFFSSFGLSGRFVGGVEDRILRAVQQLT